METYKSESEINELVESFIDTNLPKEKWTHGAHLTTAIWHLKSYDFYEALCLIKCRIIAYNLSVGGVNNSSMGYHETLTVFWMKVVYFYTTNHKQKTLVETCNSFLNSQLSTRELPFYFYEKEKLMAAKARAIYMECNRTEFDYGTLGKILRNEIVILKQDSSAIL